MDILTCSDGSFYVGSKTDLELRLVQHDEGDGAECTKRRLTAATSYFEEHERIDDAYAREEQVQGWG